MEEINLKELFNYYLSKMWVVLITLFIALSSMYIYSEYVQIPMYKSYTTLVLKSQNDNPVNQNDITVNQKLVSTYREIIKSRRVLEKVVQNLNLNESWQEIQNSITVTTVNSTEMIKISVSNEDSRKAYLITDEIARVFINVNTEIYGIENISVCDYSLESTTPYNINLTKQMLLAAIAGIVLGSGIILVIFYFDTTIKSSEDIENKLGLIVLGNVPKSKMTINKSNKQEIKKVEPKKEVKLEIKEEKKKEVKTTKTTKTTTKKSTKKGVNK